MVKSLRNRNRCMICWHWLSLNFPKRFNYPDSRQGIRNSRLNPCRGLLKVAIFRPRRPLWRFETRRTCRSRTVTPHRTHSFIWLYYSNRKWAFPCEGCWRIEPWIDGCHRLPLLLRRGFWNCGSASSTKRPHCVDLSKFCSTSLWFCRPRSPAQRQGTWSPHDGPKADTWSIQLLLRSSLGWTLDPSRCRNRCHGGCRKCGLGSPRFSPEGLPSRWFVRNRCENCFYAVFSSWMAILWSLRRDYDKYSADSWGWGSGRIFCGR